MNLYFNIALAETYKNPSQKIRVLSESWMAENMFCPCCGHEKILKFTNNRPVADFYCPNCKRIFELKSKNGTIGSKISDGTYATAIERITSNQNPELLVLQYDSLGVVKLTLTPKHFFTPDVIEKRKPLAATARRAGWTGCNILYGRIPEQGKIPIIHDRQVVDKRNIIAAYTRSSALAVCNMEQRSWLFDVLQCVNSIPQNQFTLKDMYMFVDTLHQRHTENHNIHAKIRQQLQLLRDKGYIIFLGNGHYQKVFF